MIGKSIRSPALCELAFPKDNLKRANFQVQSSLTNYHYNQMRSLSWTITQKTADQSWSDIYVVFTKILCGRNFCVW